MSTSVRFCDNCGATNRADAKFCYACGQPQITFPTSTVTGLLMNASTLKQRYRILEKIGQGGFGAIYKVEDTLFNSALRAMKEMGMRGMNAQEIQQAILAFRNEAQLLANLSHPNLPHIYDYFEEHNRWYLVMDFISGETLAHRLEQVPAGNLPLREVLQIGLQICTVLEYLHAHQPPIIFRDLKPDNIMLTKDNHLFLIDFGIARFFKPGQSKDTMSLGTPGYAAPEQYGRMQTTVRSDIYSLGATLYHLASGVNPGLTPFLFQPLDLQPVTPATTAFSALVMQMLEMKEEKRPQSAQSVRQALKKIQPLLPAVHPAVRSSSTSSGFSTSGTRFAAVQDATLALDSALLQPQPSVVVAQQGGGDYRTLGEALQKVVPNSLIMVREGIYNESLVLDKAVDIVGNGAKERIVLTGTSDPCVTMQTGKASLRGLTMRVQCSPEHGLVPAVSLLGGSCVIEDCDISSQSGSCIVATGEQSDLIVRYTTLHDSPAYGLLLTQGARATVEHGDITCATLSGILANEDDTIVLRHCTVHHNQKHGVELQGQSRGTLEDCALSHNTGSGVLVTTGSSPLCLRCQMQYNLRHGVEVEHGGQGSYQDCTISANHLANVAISTQSTPYFYLCKIMDGENCGVTCRDDGEGMLEYCDISGNQAANVTIDMDGNPHISHCKLERSQRYSLESASGARGSVDHSSLVGSVLGALSQAKGGSTTLKSNTLS